MSAYHHWDGYPEWLGRILKTHYNTLQTVIDLIEGGDMNSCWTNERWNDISDDSYGPNYYSYRGENCPFLHDDSLLEYLENGEEYLYLYVDEEWVCYNYKKNKIEIPSASLYV